MGGGMDERPCDQAGIGRPTFSNLESCNVGVSQGFASQGDGMRNGALLLTDLVNEGIRLLVYAGTAGMCPSVI